MDTDFFPDFMACSDLYDVCNPVNNRCTGWNTTYSLLNFTHWVSTLDLNAQQEATFARMSALAVDNSIFDAVNGQPDALLATLSLVSTTGSLPLPDNQWRREVEGWFQTVLARYDIY